MWSKLLIALALLFPQPDTFVPGQSIPNIVVGYYGTTAFFTSSPISDELFALMDGVSYNPSCPVSREDLRYLRVLYRDSDSRATIGELVCNKEVSGELLEIFRSLYKAGYRIQSLRLIDYFGGDDLESMLANNSSCFNSRTISGGGAALSKHSWGLAVDINPYYNPCITKKGRIIPEESAPYVQRDSDFPYKISADDLCVRLFREKGWIWGGGWATMKDYQHFEKII